MSTITHAISRRTGTSFLDFNDGNYFSRYGHKPKHRRPHVVKRVFALGATIVANVTVYLCKL